MATVLFAAVLIGTVIVYERAISEGTRGRGNSDAAFLAIGLTFLSVGIVSLLLVRAEYFSLPVLGAVLIVPMVLVAICCRWSLRGVASKPAGVEWRHWVVPLALALLCIVIYGLHPTYYLAGGRDHGVYLIFAHHIATTGGLDLDLPWMGQLYQRIGDDIRLGFPGIYSAFERGLSDDPASLIPQFMHLFPSYAAIGHSIAGLEGVVRTNAVISILGLWSFYMVGRRILSPGFAALATALLAGNASFIWVTRATFTETLHITILFFGLYVLYKALDRASNRWALVAGLILGLGVLNRLSALLAILVVIGIAYWVFAYRRDLRKCGQFVICGYAIAALVGMVDGYVNSYPYLSDLWGRGELSKLVVLNIALILVAFGLLTPRWSSDTTGRLRAFIDHLVTPAILLVAVWFSVRYVMGFDESAAFSLRSAKELSWYVTPILPLLAIIGCRHLHRNGQGMVLFTAGLTLGGTLFVYTWKPSITPDHLWASRRWLAYCVPFILLLGMYAIQIAFRMRKEGGIPVAAVGVGALGIVWYGAANAVLANPFMAKSLLATYPEKYERLVEELNRGQGRDGIYGTQSTKAAGVLTYIYQVKTALISDEAVGRLNGGGEMPGVIPLGVAGNKISPAGIVLREPTFCGLLTERVRGARSDKLISWCLDISPPGKGQNSAWCAPKSLEAGSKLFSTHVGERSESGDTIRSKDESGYLLYGPYVSAETGRYRVTWYGKAREKGVQVGHADITAARGNTVLKRSDAVGPVNGDIGVLAELEFEVAREYEDVEFRFWVNRPGVVLRRVTIECIDSE